MGETRASGPSPPAKAILGGDELYHLAGDTMRIQGQDADGARTAASSRAGRTRVEVEGGTDTVVLRLVGMTGDYTDDPVGTWIPAELRHVVNDSQAVAVQLQIIDRG
jgi:hypothetical protein